MASLTVADPTRTILPTGEASSAVSSAPANTAQEEAVTNAAASAIVDLNAVPAEAPAVSETKTVVKVDKAAVPVSLYYQITATLNAAAELKKGFPANDAQSAPSLQALDALRQEKIQEAVANISKLPAKFELSDEAKQIKAVADELKTLEGSLKEKLATYRQAIAKTADPADRKSLSDALQVDFDEAKEAWSKHAASAKNLLPTVIEQWKAVREAKAQATLPITAKEHGYIKDQSTADKVKKEILDAYKAAMDKFKETDDNLKAYREALCTYLELSAMVIGYLGAAVIVEGPVVAVGYIKSIGSAVSGLLTKAETFNKHAPNPWDKGTPPNI